MDPNQANEAKQAKLVEFARNVSKKEWRVRKLLLKDEKKVKNPLIYDVFFVVYDKSEQIVKNWYVCSHCKFAVNVVQKDSGSHQLTRHPCFRTYLEERKEEEEEEEVEEEQEDEKLDEEIEIIDDYSDTVEVKQDGKLYVKWIDSDDDGNSESEKSENDDCESLSSDDDVGEKEIQNEEEDDGRSDNSSSSDESISENTEKAEDGTNGNDLNDRQHKLLVTMFNKYGENCVQSRQCLPETRLADILPHNLSDNHWDDFLESLQNVRLADDENSGGKHVRPTVQNFTHQSSSRKRVCASSGHFTVTNINTKKRVAKKDAGPLPPKRPRLFDDKSATSNKRTAPQPIDDESVIAKKKNIERDIPASDRTLRSRKKS